VQLELPVRAVLELGGGVHRQGYAIEPQVSYEVRDFSQGWSLSTSVGAVWGDAELNRFFYGVAPAYATATRPAFDAQPGLIATRLTVSTSKAITPDVRVFGYARQQFFDASANRASPLYQQSTGQSVGVGLVWMLGRSERKVPG
jgi:outer membrane scaffolding protein for murein synthesis (MipA/OmpV family)